MIITEVYDRFKIHTGLREHMLRVAAVVKFMLDNSNGVFDEKNIISAALLHDLGNLIKSDVTTFPDLFEPEGVDYWLSRKEEMFDEYGDSEDKATLAMIAELGINPEVSRIVDRAHMEVVDGIKDDLSSQVMLYADMRVKPYGIASLSERFADIGQRYVPKRFNLDTLNHLHGNMIVIENQIFSNLTIAPEDITDEVTVDIQKELLNWKLK